MVDTGYVPTGLSYEERFGLVMNSARMIHRRAYRRLWEDMLVLSDEELPFEIFQAASASREEAEKMQHDYNAAKYFKQVES